MDSSDLNEIASLDRKSYSLELAMVKSDAKVVSAGRNLTTGVAALLVGGLGLIFVFNWWPIWAFLLAAGVLLLVTIGNRWAARREQKANQAEWTQMRIKLGKLGERVLAG